MGADIQGGIRTCGIEFTNASNWFLNFAETQTDAFKLWTGLVAQGTCTVFALQNRKHRGRSIGQSGGNFSRIYGPPYYRAYVHHNTSVGLVHTANMTSLLPGLPAAHRTRHRNCRGGVCNCPCLPACTCLASASAFSYYRATPGAPPRRRGKERATPASSTRACIAGHGHDRSGPDRPPRGGGSWRRLEEHNDKSWVRNTLTLGGKAKTFPPPKTRI